jgi:hypothetical protein
MRGAFSTRKLEADRDISTLGAPMPDHLLIRRERASTWTLRLARPDADPVLIGEVCRTPTGYTATTAEGAELADPATGEVEYASLQAAADELAAANRRRGTALPAPVV